MSRRFSNRIPTAPLQELEAVPVTDPVELEMIEKQLKGAKAANSVSTNGTFRTQDASQILELARALSEDERFLVLARLGTELPFARRCELVEHLGSAESARVQRQSQ